jgi:predicted molibdopterin-dependent oxidoreductase YjgC
MGGLHNVFSGYQSVIDPGVRERFERAWGSKGLPDRVGLTLTEMIKEAEEGRLKALFVMGENPLVSDPDAKHVIKAIKRLELLVVQDIFPTETSAMAHVLLPAQAYAEKEGTYTNTERRVQFSEKAIEPPNGTRPDWEILCDLGSRLGLSMDYGGPEAVQKEISKLTPSYGGISYDRIRGSFGLQWPCPTQEHPGTPYLHKEAFPKGRAEFVGLEHMDLPEPPSEEYPLLLTTGRLYPHYHTRSLTKRIDLLEREGGRPQVVINPRDAKRLRVREGMLVAIESRRGEIKRQAHISEEVPEGVVFAAFHYGESNINELTLSQWDPVAKIPELKACAVAIRRL